MQPATLFLRVIMSGYKKTLFKCAGALGLFHMGATLFVRESNLNLMEKTGAILTTGALAIPTPAMRPSLDSWEAALGGALFFTLTVGALTLFGALIAPSLHRLGRLSRKRALGLHGALGLLLLGLMGIGPETRPLLMGGAGVFLLMLPPLLIPTSPGPRNTYRLPTLLVHLLVPLLLGAGITATHLALPSGLFSGFRDAFLFDNPMGNTVRRFYYTYTLFPAEAFKRLDQKSQVTVRMLGTPKAATRQWLAQKRHIPVTYGPFDYTLDIQENSVVLNNGGTPVSASAALFRTNPTSVFRDFSMQNDPFAPLRTLTWYALLTAFPLLCYLLVHTLFTLLGCLFMPRAPATLTATLAVTLMAAGLLILLISGHSLPREALGTLSPHGGTTGALPEAMRKAARHPSALVRYRAALAARRLGASVEKHTLLSRLARDSDPNVACQALGSMGATGDRNYIDELEEMVRTHPQWYVQWYGYRAMGRL